MSLLDLLTDLGVEIVRPKIHNKLTENQARERLNAFLSKQQKLNDICSLEEEIDFEGIAKYIQSELIEDVRVRLISGDPHARDEARREIITKATHYAQANTKLSVKRATRIIDSALNILKEYYRSKINQELLFVSNEIIECIESESKATRDEIDAVRDVIDETAILSLDNNVKLAASGKIVAVQTNLSVFMRGISSQHSLYPYYRYDLRDHGQIVSVPTTDEAISKYPPTIRIVPDRIRVGDQDYADWDAATLWESYRKQEPIEVHVSEAQKYLGDVLDPTQSEAEELKGALIKFAPKPFPKAEPCSFMIDNEIVLDYLLMRTRTVEEDGTAIWANDEEPNRIIQFECIIPPSFNRFSFNLNTTHNSVDALLLYYKTIERICRGGEAAIKMLEKREVVIRGPIPKQDSSDAEQAVIFYSKLSAIETFFEVSFEIPETIDQNDLSITDYLYSLATAGKAKSTWREIKVSYKANESNRKIIKNLKDEPLYLVLAFDVTINFFGSHFSFPIQRHYESATVNDLEKLKQKVELLDEEDTYSLKYIAFPLGSEGTYTDYYGEENTCPKDAIE